MAQSFTFQISCFTSDTITGTQRLEGGRNPSPCPVIDWIVDTKIPKPPTPSRFKDNTRERRVV